MAALVPPLKYVTIPALSKHTATVIFAHGLGDTGHGWTDVADMLQKDNALKHIKWVLPHAPSRPVTLNMRMTMPAWFDISSLDFDGEEDSEGMLKTVHSLNQLITTEVDDNSIPASRIVLGGFSQGAAMSLLTGFTTERRLAGIAVLSGWLPLRAKFASMVSAHASSVPVFWGHGTVDPLVNIELGRRSVEWLKKQLKPPAKDLAFNEYAGVEHSTSEKELADFKEWLAKVLPQES